MRADQLFENIGAVDEELLARSEANAAEARRKRRLRVIWSAAAAAAVVVIVGVAIAMKTGIFRNKKTPKEPANNTVTAGSAERTIDLAKDEVLGKYLIASRVMPAMNTAPEVADYIDASGILDSDGYKKAEAAFEDQYRPYREKLQEYGVAKAVSPVNAFNEKAMSMLLANRGGANRTYSPINIYFALAMLSELTDGNTRAELLSLTGADTVQDLRTRANAMWEHLYKNDEHGKLILGSSLWLREKTEASDEPNYNTETLQRLADYYYAASFRGKMGSAEYDNALRQWLNKQTGGLLKDAVDGISLDPETVLALATTVWFAEKWQGPFDESLTSPGVFHAADGEKQAEFMNTLLYSQLYYYGDNFVSVPLRFISEANASMWFVLPEEGSTVDDLLTDPEVLALLEQGYGYQKTEQALIDLTVPKFDISYSCDLCGVLEKLGVKDVFNPETSDFSSMVTDETVGYYVSEMKHSARVRIDEKGAEAAAFTEIAAFGTSLPTEQLVLRFDRPFLFVIRSESGIPLFVGVVENPQSASAS